MCVFQVVFSFVDFLNKGFSHLCLPPFTEILKTICALTEPSNKGCPVNEAILFNRTKFYR